MHEIVASGLKASIHQSKQPLMGKQVMLFFHNQSDKNKTVFKQMMKECDINSNGEQICVTKATKNRQRNSQNKSNKQFKLILVIFQSKSLTINAVNHKQHIQFDPHPFTGIIYRESNRSKTDPSLLTFSDMSRERHIETHTNLLYMIAKTIGSQSNLEHISHIIWYMWYRQPVI